MPQNKQTPITHVVSFGPPRPETDVPGPIVLVSQDKALVWASSLGEFQENSLVRSVILADTATIVVDASGVYRLPAVGPEVYDQVNASTLRLLQMWAGTADSVYRDISLPPEVVGVDTLRLTSMNIVWSNAKYADAADEVGSTIGLLSLTPAYSGPDYKSVSDGPVGATIGLASLSMVFNDLKSGPALVDEINCTDMHLQNLAIDYNTPWYQGTHFDTVSSARLELVSMNPAFTQDLQ